MNKHLEAIEGKPLFEAMNYVNKLDIKDMNEAEAWLFVKMCMFDVKNVVDLREKQSTNIYNLIQAKEQAKENGQELPPEALKVVNEGIELSRQMIETIDKAVKLAGNVRIA